MKKSSNKKTNGSYNINDDISLKKIIITFLFVLMFLGLFYGITLGLTTKSNNDNSSKNSEDGTSISYNTVLASSSFDLGDEYIILYYDNSADNSSEFTGLISSYMYRDEHVDIYSVDIGSGLNKKYVTTDESNKLPDSVDNLKINGATLIYFKNHVVVDYVEGLEEISNYLQ